MKNLRLWEEKADGVHRLPPGSHGPFRRASRSSVASRCQREGCDGIRGGRGRFFVTSGLDFIIE